MPSEKVKLKITLSAELWEKPLKFSIWFDSHQLLQSELPNKEPHEFTFERDIDEGEHAIQIRLEDKDKYDTVLEDGKIIKDMVLNIDDITIDDVSLGNLLWSAEYHLDQEQEYQGKRVTRIDNCVNLGFNGSYILKFTSPFYTWLLEKL